MRNKACSFYNEIDPFCCGVLKRRIADGQLPYGIVNEKPIQQITPETFAECRQIHLFAGIGGFGLAAQLAGLLEDFSILTGGFPCQPFSVAGKRQGDRDDRFLWPGMLRLIRGARPAWVLGENVPGIDDKNLVLDRVLSDLEESGYEGRAFEIPACGVNAPILRRRVWIVARAKREGLEVGQSVRADHEPECTTSERGRADVGRAQSVGRREGRPEPALRQWEPASTFAGASFLRCADGKVRRIPKSESGIQLVASGIPQRMARLKAAGNAICPQVAAEIMKAMIEAEEDYALWQ